MFEQSNSRLFLILAFFLIAISIVSAIDLWQDDISVWKGIHAIVELLFTILSLGMAIFLWAGWRKTNQSLNRTKINLAFNQKERDAWRTKAEGYVKGLAEEISKQMNIWNLTPTEIETAFFLLKGFSYKEISHFTKKSERTVRQHGIAIFKKSGLGGRAELSAFFLEDLLLPRKIEG